MATLRDSLARWRAMLHARERAQGLLEYGLIISVVSIAAVVLIMAMGPRVASMFSTAGASAFPSDRRRKGGFAAVNCQELLAGVLALPLETWTYVAKDATLRHVGPAADEFRRQFGLGGDGTHIALVDANGVTLTAIQGLYELVQGQKAQATRLANRLAALDTADRLSYRQRGPAQCQ